MPGPGISEKPMQPSLLFTQSPNLPSRSYPSHEGEVCPHHGVAASCSSRRGNHPAQGSLAGWQHHFPEPSSQNSRVMREETITAQSLMFMASWPLVILSRWLPREDQRQTDARGQNCRPATHKGQVHFPNGTPQA